MQRMGGTSAQDQSIYQLHLDDVDRNLLQTWQDQAQERATDFTLGFWDGDYPEKDMEAIVTMKNVMNSAPSDALDMDFALTAEQLRHEEAALLQRGVQRWTMYAQHTRTQQFAGYTETLWHPDMPAVLNQKDTAVDPQFRQRGLGRWLKAAMIAKVLQDRPQVKHIRTNNANSNVPMRRINEALGFRHYKAIGTWQVAVDAVKQYLSN
jgi:GNAT superfamily N-acetyltransferase